ncbi:hypothetical protein [Trinickia sp.]|uniref:hypothetical protein n=1 Tax=Trinickia sp. TaxID=2571163 RepID=UPI003F7EE5F6
MWLEKFNHYGTFIDFDPNKISWLEASSPQNGAKAIGVCDLLGDTVVAMACLSGELYLFIGRERFSLQDPGVRLTYEHNENGTTTFSVSGSNHSAGITYRSWWIGAGAGVAAFGSSSDEDEDVCAYIRFMMSVETRRKHLVQKYA